MADSWRSTFRVLGAALAVVRFSSPTVAWALGTEVHHPLLRSTDGGLHWADVARPAAQGVFTRVEVLGDLVVWILQYPMGGAAQTLRTTDGGISWSVGVIVGQGLELSGFSALDANHAWMLLVEGEPSNVVRQFHTADGGLSWPELSSGIMSIAPTRDQIRTGACPHPTLSAASLITAYLVNVTPCSPALEFAVTRDGGVTWSRQTLPPSSEQSGPACIIGPAFSSARDGRLVLQAPCPPNGFGGPGHLYGTHDGGISWRPVTLPERPPGGCCPTGHHSCRWTRLSSHR